MPDAFRVRSTARFDRLVKTSRKRHKEFVQILADALAILEEDPSIVSATTKSRSWPTSKRATANTGFAWADGDSATTSRMPRSLSGIAACAGRTRIAEED
jgi:hypothetical protein